MRLIITGAGGFLGSNILKGVIKEQCFKEVIAVTLGAQLLNEKNSMVEHLHIYEAGTFEIDERMLYKEDIVINCAYPRAMKGVGVTAGLDYIEAVFRAAARAKIKGIVNISSQSVYNPMREHPAVEEDVPVLMSEYAIGKYCIEMLLRNVCEGIPYTNIRLASLIGPDFGVRVPNKMVERAIQDGEITVQMNAQRFGYLDVEDAVRGLIGIVKMKPEQWKHVYNLGGEKEYNLLEIAECVADAVKKSTGRNVVISKTDGDGYSNSALDNSLLKRDIGNYQQVELDESIKRIVNQYLGGS